MSVPPSISLVDALREISESGRQLVLVIDEEHGLLGPLTDDDIRRGLIAGLALTDPIASLVTN